MVGMDSGTVSLFNEEGDAPPPGQKPTGKNGGHLRAYAPPAAVWADIDPAYLIPGKGFGAGVDLGDHLAV